MDARLSPLPVSGANRPQRVKMLSLTTPSLGYGSPALLSLSVTHPDAGIYKNCLCTEIQPISCSGMFSYLDAYA